MKKLLVFLLVASMLFVMFAGCAAKEEPLAEASQSAEASTPTEASAPAESEAAQPSETTPAESADQEPAPETAPAEEYPMMDYTLPLFEETYELSYFWVMLGSMGGGVMPEKKDIPVWQNIEKNLNVKITWVQNGESVISEKYNLMVASGDMTDLIYESNCGAMGASSVYPGGYEKAVSDDVYVDLTELLPQYAPNYWHYVQSDENVRRELSTDNGMYYSVGMIYDKPQGCREGMFVRQDYLDATGMALPTDTDQWMQCLLKMKDNGVQYPFGASSGGDIRGGAFASAFGTALTSGYKINQSTGELVYDGTSQEMQDYITYFKEIWDNGMVNPDFVYTEMFDTSLQTSGATALFGGMNNDIESYKTNYDMDITACPPVHTPDSNGQPKLASFEYTKMRTSSMKNTCITTNCKEPEKALKFLDWFFSAGGTKVANYGWNEGESYELVNGEPQLLPSMTQRDENGVSNSMKYLIDEGPILNLVDREVPIRSEAVIAAKSTWVSYDPDQCEYISMPSVSLSVAESEEISSVATDISSKVTTDILSFMTGEKSLTDDTWADYCAEVEAMGLARMTEIYNDAYARYLQR